MLAHSLMLDVLFKNREIKRYIKYYTKNYLKNSEKEVKVQIQGRKRENWT